jgi:hypothetical protein
MGDNYLTLVVNIGIGGLDLVIISLYYIFCKYIPNLVLIV